MIIVTTLNAHFNIQVKPLFKDNNKRLIRNNKMLCFLQQQLKAKQRPFIQCFVAKNVMSIDAYTNYVCSFNATLTLILFK